jgi:ubiquinone/menaquinone biosynthesis C-methylase UbiE
MNDLNTPSRARDELTPVLLGHSAFQFVRAGCELGLFELLEGSPGLTREQLGEALKLQDRALDILLLGVTSLRLVDRGNGGYRNGAALSEVFATGYWDLVHAVVGFEAYITYAGLADFTESLRTNSNIGLRRFPGTGPTLYHRLTEDPNLSNVFYRFMRAWSEVASRYLVENVDFSGIKRILDVGGGDGAVAIAVARAFPHVQATVLDLPRVAPLAQKRIGEAGLSDRIQVVGGDIFAEAYPPDHDAVMFVHQLQIWPLDRDTTLLRTARAALPKGGTAIIMNSMSDDTLDGPLMAALASPFFAAVAGEGGMIYSWKKYEDCLREAGFEDIERIQCPGALTPHGIIVAAK